MPMPAILYNKHCYVREELAKLYVTVLPERINPPRGKRQDRASPLIIQTHCSLSPLYQLDIWASVLLLLGLFLAAALLSAL